MCGIAGFLDFSQRKNEETLQNFTERMTSVLVHRGPDDSGVWVDSEVGVAMGHRRLSIIDLSPHGHQPMHSVSGRYVIAYNGEIYNHRQIRTELEQLAQRRWRGHSDTEVILEAFETWGIEATLKRLTGMFAITLWDRQERVLHLMRDRIGEKPLYYGRAGNSFVFASELKAMRQFPKWEGTINRNALALFLRYNYIPAPYTIYECIYKLIPGTILSLSWQSGGCRNVLETQPVPFWSAREVAEQGIAEPFEGTEEQAVSKLDELLHDAIRLQMEADVPLGAFLSGGVDSSAIVALMQSQSRHPVKTFTIGFNEAGYNEANYAKEVARHLGTEHTELYVTPADAMAVISKLPVLYDEPFSDSSQIPTYLVAQLTRQYVTVSLSGDGGDELFGGYNRHFWGQSIGNAIGWVPTGMRGLAATLLKAISPHAWEDLFKKLGPVLPNRLKQSNPGDKLHKLADVLNANNPIEMYCGLVSHWKEPSAIVVDAVEPLTVLADHGQWADLRDFTQTMMYLDLVTYLPDDILVKLDRACMGVSLESRAPFLDYRVAEFAWRLPINMKVRNGQGKWILRQVLYKYVPRELIERPKTGFGVPIDSWLRGPLREWAESLLDETRLRNEGFFAPEPIVGKWREHVSGKRNCQYHLWDILMFQAWLENSKGSL